MAWNFEGAAGFDCTVVKTPGYDDLEKKSYSAFVGWITFVIILLLIALNVGFFLYMMFNRKLKYDDMW